MTNGSLTVFRGPEDYSLIFRRRQAAVLLCALIGSFIAHGIFLGASPWIPVQSIEAWQAEQAQRFSIQIRQFESEVFEIQPAKDGTTEKKEEVMTPNLAPEVPDSALPTEMLESPSIQTGPEQLSGNLLDLLPSAPKSEVEGELHIVEVEKELLPEDLLSHDRFLVARAEGPGEGTPLAGDMEPGGPARPSRPVQDSGSTGKTEEDILPDAGRSEIPGPTAMHTGLTIDEGQLFDPVSVETLNPDTLPASQDEYVPLDDEIDVGVRTFHAPNDDLGYFTLEIGVLPQSIMRPLPKEFIFVIDSSKSILPAKLRKVQDGVENGLRLLSERDTFNVIAFSNQEHRFRGASVPATPENVSRAVRFLRKLSPEGETDIYHALLPLVTEPPRLGVPYIMVLCTDGRPTTGETDSSAIISKLSEKNRGRVSIHSFGGGDNVNRYLLELLSYQNYGESHLTPDFHQIDEELTGFIAALQIPVLTKVDVAVRGVDSEEVYPRRFQDFFKGRGLSIYGRFTAGDILRIRLVGEAAGQLQELIYETEFPQADKGSWQIAENWAFHKAQHYLGEICRKGERKEFREELEILREKFGIQTAYNNTHE